MIVVRLYGTLPQQLSQLYIGTECAQRLQTSWQLDASGLHGPSALAGLGLSLMLPLASAADIASAKATRHITAAGALPDSAFWDSVTDGAYIETAWHEAAGTVAALPWTLQQASINAVLPPAAQALWATINSTVSVAVDLRLGPDGIGLCAPPAAYYEDAMAELRASVPEVHFFVFCDNVAAAHTLLATAAGGAPATPVPPELLPSEAATLHLMAACRHHIVRYASVSSWAARLGSKPGTRVCAPQHVFKLHATPASAPHGRVAQPAWPASWRVQPTRLPAPPGTDYAPAGGAAQPIRVGIVGATAQPLPPELYRCAQAQDMELATLASADDLAGLDALIFLDLHQPGNSVGDAALACGLYKILLQRASPLEQPQAWEAGAHSDYDQIFTWDDRLIDGRRYIKSTAACGAAPPYDFEVLKSAFAQRKLLAMSCPAVTLAEPERHPTQLYTHRLRAIRWLEQCQPQDFDLYGTGWDAAAFPSYRGPAHDKLATLAQYRFAICYEEAMCYPGYITDQLYDCLLAGTVPLYGGAPNIADWIPSDCYIDIGQFGDYDTLYRHLTAMEEATHAGYLDRIRTFLASPAAYPFSAACHAVTLTRFLAWNVQTRRGELPVLAREHGLLANANTHLLLQDRATLALHLTPRPAAPAASTAPPTAATIRHMMSELQRDDLIVCIGYGPELPVFLRARALWQFYASHFPRIKVFFVRDSDALPRGEVVSEGDDLVIGFGSAQTSGSGKPSQYAETGIWGADENERGIYRSVAMYDYLHRKYDHHFYVYATTITSVVDFRAVIAMLDVLPRTGCYAGLLGTLVHPPYQGVGMVHGANALLSRDVTQLLRSRYVAGHEYSKQPSDHWMGLLLRDVPRTAMPLFSFNLPRKTGDNVDDVGRLVARLVRDGHYHFRIKTDSEAAQTGRREDVDPWIMLKIMEAILATPNAPEQTLSLQQRLTLCSHPESKAARDFPINDKEAAMLYGPL